MGATQYVSTNYYESIILAEIWIGSWCEGGCAIYFLAWPYGYKIIYY